MGCLLGPDREADDAEPLFRLSHKLMFSRQYRTSEQHGRPNFHLRDEEPGSDSGGRVEGSTPASSPGHIGGLAR